MTDASGKRLLWILSLASIVVGALLAMNQYGTLWDFRSWNYIGLMFIVFVGLGALGVAFRASRTDS